MPLPRFLLIAVPLLLASCGGSGPSTTPAPTTPMAPPAPPPPPPAQVFACVTDIVPGSTTSARRILRTFRNGVEEAPTLPLSLFTSESLEGGTPTWNTVIWYEGRAATRFGAVRDGMRLFRGFDLQPVLRNPGDLRVVLRAADGATQPFEVSVGVPGEPYFLPDAAHSFLASKPDDSWSMALTDDGEVGGAVFDDEECAPPR